MEQVSGLGKRFLALLLCGLSLPVIILASIGFVFLIEFETTKRTEHYLGNVALATIRQVDSLLDRAASAAMTASVDGTILAHLGQEPAPDPNQHGQLVLHLDELVSKAGIFDLALVVNVDGILVASNSQLPHAAPLSTPAPLWGENLNQFEDELEWISRCFRREQAEPNLVKLDRGRSSVADQLGASASERIEECYPCLRNGVLPMCREGHSDHRNHRFFPEAITGMTCRFKEQRVVLGP